MKGSSIILEAKEVLMNLIQSINTLSLGDYTKRLSILSNSTIGEHTRHIVELFQQLLQGYETGVVDYDKRKRFVDIQLNIDLAVEFIGSIINLLDKENKSINLNTVLNNNETFIETNYYRELMYNVEHCIHHQAIIKIGFLFLEKYDFTENFGVAKSTIQYKEKVEK
jgi:hypothetical protein